MKNTVTEKLITAIKAQVKPTPSKDELAFLRSFYHRLSGQDFTVPKALDFRAAALRHRQLAKTRAPGTILIEAYNPTTNKNRTTDTANTTIINIIIDDKPFIIDSLTIKLNAMRKTPHHTTHPIFEVQRDQHHHLQKISRYRGNQQTRHDNAIIEAFIQFEIDFTPKTEHKTLTQELREVIKDIEVVVKDWKTMRHNTLTLAKQLEDRKQGPAFAEHGELLRWMENNHFAFLGYAEVDITDTPNTQRATLRPSSVLGVLRAAHTRDNTAPMHILPPITSSKTSPLVFTKSRQRSTIHRANYLDCILIDHSFTNTNTTTNKRRVSCILGFLAGAATRLPTAAIPHLRSKTAYILDESTLRPGGYAYKALHAIIETLPREKLFQMDTRSLYSLCMTILNHLERRKTRLHLHRNLCGHFYSCLVYIPRELFNSTLRQRIQTYLSQQLNADEVSFNVHFSDSILTRIHYLIHCRDRTDQKPDPLTLENAVQDMARDWNDNLHEALRQHHSYEYANDILTRYRDAFPTSYQDQFTVQQSIIDIERFERINTGDIISSLTQNHHHPDPHTASFKLYSDEKSIALSDALPILENMGVRVLGEHPYQFRRHDKPSRWLHNFQIERQDRQPFDIETTATNFQSTFDHAWRRQIENDGFNQLTLLAGLNWQEVSLLRAYFRYLKQIRLRYSEHYIIDSLTNNPTLVIAIIDLFTARFDPTTQTKKTPTTTRKLRTTINQQLDQVATLDEDRIIRALLDVIDATLRTNYYQTTATGQPKPYLSLKLNAIKIPRIPEPAPQYEIFVCSPRVEGVHLRGGKIARGGLRWSERPEDFRTEVLGLVKAQRVKNAVIVPVGSKGGFVAKQLPPTGRDAIQQEVIACYRLFISGLLDLTDNLKGTKIIPPKQVTRHDEDDPYLVVAADKGTATFSDIANSLSDDYGFWLGDAFASGGSAGYDHKKMGITARGAWESVKRHFRELDKDIQSTDFTAVGIGDMAGDVFGNGMLLSKHIRLIAAFNHLHIFIDPTPNAARSHKERQRLFALPRSSWADYNKKLISTGGGIFDRSAKSITLSPQAKKTLGATKTTYAPDDLINLILKSEVELLWNGGIGTYVKASTETDSAAQDKNNDSLRVDANQLRCKVIGEGGNLGMTQLARIQYAQHGGLCYTDAIDNSAGVDTSDHEVNIKILLNAAIQTKKLLPSQRNALLAKMEKQVGELVLRNNYIQTQALSLEAARSHRLMLQQSRAIDSLEQKGLLHRAIEFLPDNITLEERRAEEHWLTRPELAVLLSYSKMDLYQSLLDSDVPDDKYLAIEIDRYFPPLMAKKYPTLVRSHRLKREIISTQITNNLVGAMGPNFHLRLAELTGSNTAEITRAYIAARDILKAPTLTANIEALDNQVTATTQMQMLDQLAATMQTCTAWLLRNQVGPLNIHTLVTTFQPSCDKLKSILTATLGHNATATANKHRKHLTTNNVPAPLAAQIAALPSLGYTADITDIATRNNRTLLHTAAIYFQVRETLGFDWLEHAIQNLPATNDWHERARFSLANDLRASHTAITAKILSHKEKIPPKTLIARWQDANLHPIHTIEKMATDLQSETTPDFAMLSVLISELAWLY